MLHLHNLLQNQYFKVDYQDYSYQFMWTEIILKSTYYIGSVITHFKPAIKVIFEQPRKLDIRSLSKDKYEQNIYKTKKCQQKSHSYLASGT